MKALIDGDVIRYACGFASDTKTYIVHGPEFQYKREAKKFCDDTGVPYEDIEVKIEFEPVEHCLHSVKLMIEDVLLKAGADTHQVYLTGKGNFREEIYPEYKKNRDTSHKPHWFKEIGEYLVKTWDAVVVDGAEADDAMGIAQCVINKAAAQMKLEGLNYTESVICTIDKDLDMIPGWHYNWKRQEKYYVNSGDAIRHFYSQLLTGDSVDNIPGLKGVGPVTAKKILAGCEREWDMYLKCEFEYQARLDDTYQEQMERNARLLWIQREEGQLWSAPSLLRA